MLGQFRPNRKVPNKPPENAMRIHICCTTLGLALAVAAPAAHAQTVYTQQPDGTVIAQEPVVTMPPPAPVVAQPAQTVRTVTTVRTERPVARHRVVVTRQTTVRDSVVPPAPTVLAPPAVAAPAVATVNQGPLYNVVSPAPAVPVVAGAPVPFYRYIYEPDRILVIDPSTDIAVQAIPR
jgi:hypothetical protein